MLLDEDECSSLMIMVLIRRGGRTVERQVPTGRVASE